MSSTIVFSRRIVTAFFILGTVLQGCDGCSGDECRIIVFKEPVPGEAMRGHVIREEVVPNQQSCRVLCYMEPNCVSINLKPLEGGKYKCEVNNATDDNQFSSDLYTTKDYIYLAIENPCSSLPCINNGICQVGYTDKGYRCKCPWTFTGEHCDEACNFDFESGIIGWEKTGTVFNNQPTYDDNPKARNRESANQQGDWWIGGAENRSCKSSPAGKEQGDFPKGTLTSASFLIVGKTISFLIGGGCDINVVRAELIVNNQVVREETGNTSQGPYECSETMYRKSWDVHYFIGERARVKLVDDSSNGWGHINFDDLKGDIICVKD